LTAHHLRSHTKAAIARLVDPDDTHQKMDTTAIPINVIWQFHSDFYGRANSESGVGDEIEAVLAKILNRHGERETFADLSDESNGFPR